MRTQGEIEAAISEGIIRFEQDYMGRGPKDIHTHLLGDLVVVRLQGVLTAAEQHLVKSLPAEKGRDLLKQVRTHLIETARPIMEAMVEKVTGVKVVTLHLRFGRGHNTIVDDNSGICTTLGSPIQSPWLPLSLDQPSFGGGDVLALVGSDGVGSPLAFTLQVQTRPAKRLARPTRRNMADQHSCPILRTFNDVRCAVARVPIGGFRNHGDGQPEIVIQRFLDRQRLASVSIHELESGLRHLQSLSLVSCGRAVEVAA